MPGGLECKTYDAIRQSLFTDPACACSDSIIASILGLLAMHLVVHDYGRADSERPTETLSGSFSLNAAVFASILPASRMQTPLHVFASVSSAVGAAMCAPVLHAVPGTTHEHFCSLPRASYVLLRSFSPSACTSSCRPWLPLSETADQQLTSC